jgi:hypothetical protein
MYNFFSSFLGGSKSSQTQTPITTDTATLTDESDDELPSNSANSELSGIPYDDEEDDVQNITNQLHNTKISHSPENYYTKKSPREITEKYESSNLSPIQNQLDNQTNKQPIKQTNMPLISIKDIDGHIEFKVKGDYYRYDESISSFDLVRNGVYLTVTNIYPESKKILSS